MLPLPSDTGFNIGGNIEVDYYGVFRSGGRNSGYGVDGFNYTVVRFVGS